MWYVFALAAGVLYTASILLTRRSLNKGGDPWVFSFYFSAIGALVSIPFVFVGLQASATFLPWAFLLITAALVVFHNFLNFTALKHLNASVHGTFYKLRLVWSFLLGIIFLQESWTALTLVGVAATVTAGALLLWKKGEPVSKVGLLFVFGSSVVNVLALLLYKQLFADFNVGTLTFMMFFVPAILNALIIPNFWQKAAGATKNHVWTLGIACTLGGFANLAMNQSIALGQVTGTLVIIEACLIFILAGEHFFLKERKDLFRKAAAVLLATIGAICILVV